MHATPLRSITVSATTAQFLEDVRLELDRLLALGQFPPEVQSELARSFLPDRISDTLNIESFRVNPRLTRAVLEGLTIAETDKYTEREIINVNEANALVEEEARSGSPLTPLLLLEVHRRLTETLQADAGVYRTSQVTITGAKQQPGDWHDVPDLVREVCEHVNDGHTDPIVTAAWAHARIAAIHPFTDGNGRVARLIQDFVLCQNHLLAVGVPISRRDDYYDALQLADQNDFDSMITLIASAEIAALDKARRIASAPNQRRERIQKIVRAARQTVRQTEYNQYEVWRRRMEALVDEFVRWLDDLNSESNDFQFRYRTYDMKSFDRWCEIRDRGWAVGTWLLLIDVVVRAKSQYKFLLYAKRHHLDWTVDSSHKLRDQVGIFLDASSDQSEPFSLSRYSDPYIALRELVYDGSQLLVFRDPRGAPYTGLPEGVTVQGEHQLWDCTDDLEIGDVIEEFLEQVLTKLGLIDL